MGFNFCKTSIDGLILIEPHISIDDRGYFIKEFEKNVFSKNNLPTTFVENNESKSKKGTLRGIHFQTNHSQGKLIRVIKGAVYDVAVDLRYNSPTFGKWEGFELSDINHIELYIPPFFGHGFLALENDTIFSYKCTDEYCPEYDSGIKYDDSDIAIDWQFDKLDCEMIISDKDRQLQSFIEFKGKKIFSY